MSYDVYTKTPSLNMLTQHFPIIHFVGMLYFSNMGYTGVEECPKGYFGPFCEGKCPYPSYGLGCQSLCTCIEENCSFENGCFKSNSKLGNDTTNPESAQTSSKSFTPGMKNYTQSRNPLFSEKYSPSRPRRTTSPHASTECKIGYFGPFCESKCPYPSYGLGCQSICECGQERCNFENGCIQTTSRLENSETTKRQRVSEILDSANSEMNTHVSMENLAVESENSFVSRTCRATTTLNNMLDNSVGLIISIVVIFSVSVLLFVMYIRHRTYNGIQCNVSRTDSQDSA